MKKCVLIYDDDDDILDLCKAILIKSPYHVETLNRCENVASDITRLNPAIIFMDLWIPDIGGERAITIIRNKENTRHIPVILFSANAQIKEIAEKVNADGYLEKPFDVLLFKEIIEKNIT